MQAGLLKEWIEIERETVERDIFGGETRKWETAFRKKARIQFRNGDQTLENRETVHTIVNTVTIRYQPGIDRKMRLSWGGEKYRILAVYRNRQEMSLVIKCELINK